MKSLPTIEQLNEWLKYDPETGFLHWKKRPSNRLSEHYQSVPAGGINTRGYVTIQLRGKDMRVHRVVWAMVTGAWPKEHIDHINGIPSDNRFCNLREATNAENVRNAKLSKNNRSGVKGVYYERDTDRWVANVEANGSVIRKRFKTMEGAISEVRFIREHLHGEFARHE
jgi:hypothetical protein